MATASRKSKTPSESKAPSEGLWRRQFRIDELVPLVRKAATALNIPEASEIEDPKESTARKKTGDLMFSVIIAALESVASGAGGAGIELGNRPEPFFNRARRDSRANEKKSQREAIGEFLETKSDDGINISEAELVQGALRAAPILNMPNYTLSDLTHEGIRRVAQEMVSNAANVQNSASGEHRHSTLAGRNWANYEKTLNELRVDLMQGNWPYRKPYITPTIIASRVKPATNVVQIKRWLLAIGEELIPRSEVEASDDLTAGGRIVDPKK